MFTYVDTDGTLKDLYATVQDFAKIKLSGNLAVSRTHDKRISYVSCTSAEKALIKKAAASAQTYASKAYDAMQSITSSTRRYKTWFGTYTSARHSLVQGHFWLIGSHKFSDFTYDCTCNDPEKWAYVRAYIFQCWNFRSGADQSLDYIRPNSERSTSAVLSGMLPTPVLIPRLERLSMNLPTSR